MTKTQIINGLMKEVTFHLEYKANTITLKGDVIDESANFTDIIELKHPRTVDEYSGNRMYLDRVKINIAAITQHKLRQIAERMTEDFLNTHSTNTVYLKTFILPGTKDEYCRELEEPGFFEIRLFCKYDD